MSCLKRKKSLRSITERRDFERAFKEGVKSTTKYLVVYARPNELNCNRLGLSVSKKIGKAVQRNRIKRLLREAMRQIAYESTSHYDFVIIAKTASAEGGLNNFIHDIHECIVNITPSTSSAGGEKGMGRKSSSYL